MDRRLLQLLRIVCYVMLAWFVVSTVGRFHWCLSLLVTAFAISNMAIVWMLREHRYRLAVACRRRIIRKYVDAVCFFTGDQTPLEMPSTGRGGEVKLRTDRDFENAAARAKQVVRGHDYVLDNTLSRIYENQTLRRTRRAGGAIGPLASFLLAGDDGVGKRYLMRVLSKVLYGSGAIDVFDCGRITPDDLVGTKDRRGDLLEIVRKRPHTLVLFERIEKASPDAAKLFVELLTSGKLCQPSSQAHVSFQEATIAFATAHASSAVGALGSDPIGGAAWQQRAIELIGDETQIDEALLNAVTDICFFESPSDLVKAEVVALLMKKECTAHNIELSHVDPEIIATQVLQIDNGSGFRLVPPRVNKLLRKPLVAAAVQRPESLSLRVRSNATLVGGERS